LLIWGDQFDSRLTESYNAWSFISSAFFLNQSWNNPAVLPWNYPHWSICYEFFYYLLFGAFAFLEGKKRVLCVFIIALIAGPAVLILLPVWALGAALIYNQKFRIRSEIWAIVIFIFTAASIYFISSIKLHDHLQAYLYQTIPGWWRLGFSQRFVTDYLVAILIALHFCSARTCGHYLLPVLNILKPVITFLAGFAFTIYLFHRPITLMLSQIGITAENAYQFTGILAFILCSLYLLSKTGESRRDALKTIFERLNARFIQKNYAL
jgi:peptidoglycan/LPS O-acetylase OafA/YrhL